MHTSPLFPALHAVRSHRSLTLTIAGVFTPWEWSKLHIRAAPPPPSPLFTADHTPRSVSPESTGREGPKEMKKQEECGEVTHPRPHRKLSRGISGSWTPDAQARAAEATNRLLGGAGGGACQGVQEKTGPQSWCCPAEVHQDLPAGTAGQSRACSHWCPS